MGDRSAANILNQSHGPKPRRIIVRFSEREYQAYLHRTQNLHTTRSRLIRHLVREFLGLGPDLFGPELKTIAEGIYQLGALGRNLNQLLRVVNSGQMTGQPLDLALLTPIKQQVRSLEAEWVATVKRSRNRQVHYVRA